MISSEVKRTLVKSPPELWAELSDPAALARHLGELGEISITRTEPEKLVEWEAADTNGKVLLKSSGWGTKVTLSVTREATEPAVEPVESIAQAESVVADEPAVEPEPEPLAEPVAIAEEPDPKPVTTDEPIQKPGPAAVAEEPIVVAEPPVEEPVALEKPDPEPQTRQGFFARLFRRRAKDLVLVQDPIEQVPQATIEPGRAGKMAPEPEPEPEAPAARADAAPVESAQPEAIVSVDDNAAEDIPLEDASPTPPDAPDIAAELKAAEEAATEEVTAVLIAALDRLGAAHHRPFSRA